MQNPTASPESIWDDLLSRDRNQICTAFDRLPLEEKQPVLDHLIQMSSGPGWHPGQRESARIALQVLGHYGK